MFIAVIALFALPYFVLSIVIFLAGMTINGSQTGVNGPPTRMFLVAGLFALIAAAATSLLVFRNTRVASA